MLYVIAFSRGPGAAAAAPAGAQVLGSAGGRGMFRRRAPRLPNHSFLACGTGWGAARLRAGRGAFVMAQHPWVRFGEGFVRRLQARRTGAPLLWLSHTPPNGKLLRSRRTHWGAIPPSLSQQRPGSCRWSQVLAACHRPCLGLRPAQAPRAGASRPDPHLIAQPPLPSLHWQSDPPSTFRAPRFRGPPRTAVV